MMEILEKKTVRVKDRSVVEKKLHEFITGGPSKLQVISDFDYTISKAHQDGVKYDTTHDIFTQSPLVPEEYRRQSKSLLNYYYRAIGADPNMSRQEKIGYMAEWYKKEVNLMPTSGISEADVPEIVKASNVCLRDGCYTLFESLHKHNVPLLIFSAGVVEVVKEVLKPQNLLQPNTKIIANFMDFDEKRKLQGLKGTMIHPLNKKWTAIGKDNDYFDSLKSRNNIILLGDSLGDIDMSDGVDNANVILRIGFLNFRIEDAMSDYLDAYDIVLTDDPTMDVVNGLLRDILC